MTHSLSQSLTRRWQSAAAVALFSLAACDSSTAPGTSAQIRMAAPAVIGQSTAAGGGLTIVGSNGTLVITDIKMIVNEFELSRAETVDCDDDVSPSGSDSCGEFETKYFVADVPLGTGAVTVANDRIPAGTYTGMEFEVEDLEVDDGDADDATNAATINALLTQLRATYANWPARASMMIEGTFTPTGGVAQSFRVYFDAELEIETDFLTPLVIDGTSAGLTIDLRPDLWFKNEDGTVRNLALSNCSTVCNLVEFELEIESGFEVELDD